MVIEFAVGARKLVCIREVAGLLHSPLCLARGWTRVGVFWFLVGCVFLMLVDHEVFRWDRPAVSWGLAAGLVFSSSFRGGGGGGGCIGSKSSMLSRVSKKLRLRV